MVVVDAHVLSSPKLKYGGSTGDTPKNGTWNMNKKTFLKPALMPAWTLLRLGAAAKMTIPVLRSHLKALTDSFNKLGLKTVIPKDEGPTLELPRAANGDPGINKSVVDKSLKETFRQHKQEGIAMFLVILPTEDAWLFNRIKSWGEVVFGIISSVPVSVSS